MAPSSCWSARDLTTLSAPRPSSRAPQSWAQPDGRATPEHRAPVQPSPDQARLGCLCACSCEQHPRQPCACRLCCLHCGRLQAAACSCMLTAGAKAPLRWTPTHWAPIHWTPLQQQRAVVSHGAPHATAASTVAWRRRRSDRVRGECGKAERGTAERAAVRRVHREDGCRLHDLQRLGRGPVR